MNRGILFILILVFLGLGRADGGQERPVGNEGAEPGGELRSIPLVDGTVLTSRLSWLPFCFLCFKRAWFPAMLSFAGTGSLVLYAVNLSLE